MAWFMSIGFSLLFLIVLPFSNCNQHEKVSPGLLKLIVKAYVKDLMGSIEDESLKHKLNGLGHPALQQKLLFVGQEPPDYDPDKMRSGRTRSLSSVMKRAGGSDVGSTDASGSADSVASSTSSSEPVTEGDVQTTVDVKAQFPSEEICITNRQWEQINETNDFYDNHVQIVQEEGLQQFVFTYRCVNSKSSCTGISSLYHSECTERFGWIYMYYRREPTEAPIWGYVATPHHCACKIQPLVRPDQDESSQK